MIKIHSIVAASDLSAPARRAADRAARLARATSASLTLVYAVSGSALDELRRWLDRGSDSGQAIVEEQRARLHELASDLGARHRITVDECMVTGRPVEEIARIAEERKADLVVTGTLGAGAFRNRLVGSTAERVLRKSARPVLMVRQSPHEAYRRVLVAIDFSRWSAPSLELATAVAPDAQLVLVHGVQVPFEGRAHLTGVTEDDIARYRGRACDEATARLAELAAHSGIEGNRWIALTPTGMDPWMQIVRQEQEQDCDLIVIGKHGRHAAEELLLGSTTRMVIAEGSSDVLVCTNVDAP
jgi:nucleotide-binding universal stress UspA family protein